MPSRCVTPNLKFSTIISAFLTNFLNKSRSWTFFRSNSMAFFISLALSKRCLRRSLNFVALIPHSCQKMVVNLRQDHPVWDHRPLFFHFTVSMKTQSDIYGNFKNYFILLFLMPGMIQNIDIPIQRNKRLMLNPNEYLPVMS